MTLSQQLEETYSALNQNGLSEADIGVVLGTGLGIGFKDKLQDTKELSFSEIPHLPSLDLEGHPGIISWGQLNERKVINFHGRLHCYEGYSAAEVAYPIRILQRLGVKTLIVTNIAGGLNPAFREGDFMAITDHINLMGVSPLIGPNDDKLGPRFPDMIEPYTRSYLRMMERVGFQEDISVREGVYVGVMGPQLETRAEYRFLRNCGADAVGMSTIPEVLAAAHAGIKVLGLSLITDLCNPENLKPVNIEKILKIASNAEPKLIQLISLFLEKLTNDSKKSDTVKS